MEQTKEQASTQAETTRHRTEQLEKVGKEWGERRDEGKGGKEWGERSDKGKGGKRKDKFKGRVQTPSPPPLTLRRW